MAGEANLDYINWQMNKRKRVAVLKHRHKGKKLEARRKADKTLAINKLVAVKAYEASLSAHRQTGDRENQHY